MAEEIQTEIITQTEEKSDRKHLAIFWARMLGWLATGLGAPIAVFAIKFGLFNKSGYQLTVDEMGNVTTSVTAMNGWGIVSCLLVGFTIISILKEVLSAYESKYSLTKQCLTGVVKKIIPITIAILICYFLKGVLDQIMFCLTVIGIGQLVAIPLNPLPEWKYRKQGKEDYSDLISGAAALIKDWRTEKGDK